VTWGRFCIAMVGHANDLAAEVHRLEALDAAEREAQMLEAEVAGRPVWQYSTTADQLADVRDGWRAMVWGIGDTTRRGPTTEPNT
jgi:hypothetical protein